MKNWPSSWPTWTYTINLRHSWTTKQRQASAPTGCLLSRTSNVSYRHVCALINLSDHTNLLNAQYAYRTRFTILTIGGRFSADEFASDSEMSDFGGPSGKTGESHHNGTKKKRILTAADLSAMHGLAIPEFPLGLTQWNVDPFPDGVMSLPVEVRSKLRKGGQCEIFSENGVRAAFLWKSSHDLV